MVKYYSFLFVASICCFTVLCVSAATVNAPGATSGTDADFFHGNLEAAFQALSTIEDSKNPFVTFVRDMAKKYIDDFEKDKELIQDAVTKGTKMEEKIQTISNALKNSTKPLPEELQSQIEEIGSHAAAELTKLKEMENVNDIDEMHKRYKNKYTEIKSQIEGLSKLALSEIEKGKTTTTGSTGSSSTGSGTSQNSNSFPEAAKTKLIEFIKTSVPVFFAMNKDAETISKKIEATTSVLSNIHDELIKLEQMEYHLLGAYKDLFKTDVASLTRSSMAQFAFAIMFGMLF